MLFPLIIRISELTFRMMAHPRREASATWIGCQKSQRLTRICGQRHLNSSFSKALSVTHLAHQTCRGVRSVPSFGAQKDLGARPSIATASTVPGAKERLTAGIWTINSYYGCHGTVQVLSLRSKKIGLFENFVGWNYLVVFVRH